MALEKARTALLEELLGGGAALANQASRCANVLDKHALQQIYGRCFVKLHQLGLLQCDACGKAFQKRSRLMAHYFDTHVNEDLQESDVITAGDTSANIDKEPDLTIIRRTDRNKLKLHQCDICKESFAFKVDMLIHKLKHSGKEPPTCEICQKLFVNKSNLKTHAKRCHTTENLYTCDVCGKQFYALIYLKRHKKRHSDIKPYSCEFCKKNFQIKENMMRHRRTHTGETPYTCVCGRQFPFRSGLKSHNCTYLELKQTQPLEKYQCDYCNRKYKCRVTLINHIRIHLNTQKYSCNYCSKKFNVPSKLKIHTAKHTGNFPFKCSICDSKFAEKFKLDRHMNTHTRNKVYTCEICGTELVTKYGLGRHLLTHTKAYQCTECKKSFHHKYKLDRHIDRCVYGKSSGTRKLQKKKRRKANITDSDSSYTSQ